MSTQLTLCVQFQDNSSIIRLGPIAAEAASAGDWALNLWFQPADEQADSGPSSLLSYSAAAVPPADSANNMPNQVQLPCWVNRAQRSTFVMYMSQGTKPGY